MTMRDEQILCYCLRRRKAEVVRAWRSRDWRDIEEFMNETKVGTVCTSCRSTLRHLILEELPKERGVLAGDAASLPVIRGRTERALTGWKRIRRSLRKFRKRYTGPKMVSYHAVWRLDDGFESAIAIANTRNRMFPEGTVDLKCRVSCYGPDGVLLRNAAFSLPVDTVENIDVRAFLDEHCRGFGLVQMTVYPQRRRDLKRWKTGTNRPYLTLSKDGNMMTVHEKTLWFDTPRVVPGIDASPDQDTIFAMANIEDVPGSVSVRLHADQEPEERILQFHPRAALLWQVPQEVRGKRVNAVELLSSVHISGYQFTRNRNSGLHSVQHLVKEGN